MRYGRENDYVEDHVVYEIWGLILGPGLLAVANCTRIHYDWIND